MAIPTGVRASRSDRENPRKRFHVKIVRPRLAARVWGDTGGYILAIVAVCVATTARLLLDVVLADHIPYAMFFAAVAFAAWFGGGRPALVATGLGFALAWYFVVPPRFSFSGVSGPHLVGLVMYVSVGLAIAGFGEAMWAARRRAEEHGERLRTTLASIGDAVITTDVDGRVINMNSVGEALTAWTNAEAKGQPLDAVFRIVNEKTRQVGENPAKRVLREGVVVGLANHTTLIAKDGTEHPIDDSAAPIYCKAGEIVGCVLVFRDITDRRAAEAQILAERDRVQAVADAVPALISYIDTDARYQLNNRAYETWFKQPQGDFLGKHLRDVLGEAAWAAIRPHFEKTLKGQVVSYEAEVSYQEGGTRWIMATYTPDVGDDGTVRGLIAHVNDITALKQAERKVATTLESITDGFVRYDRDWRVVYVNAEAERIHQFTRSEMLGKIIWELFPALLGTKLEHEFRRAVTDHVTVEFENYYEPWDRWYALKGYPTPDGGLTTFIRDITEQKTQQEALAASEARFRHLADAMPQIVYTASPDGHIELVNARWQEFTGQLQVETADLQAVVHPEDLAGLIERWQAAMDAGTPLEAEFRLRRAFDGEYRWFLTRTVPIRDAANQLVKWYGTSTDIHDHKVIEEQIARLAAESDRQRRLYETVLTNTPDLAYVFDLDHRFTYANHALLTMWGQTWDEAIGKNCLELGYEPWHAAMHDREIEQVVATRQPVRGEVAFTGTNGKRQYDYIFVPVIGTNGEVEAVAGTTRDVTDRKRVEEALRLSEERLRLVVESATGFAIFTLDGSGVVTGWNSGAERLFGYTDAEVLGKHDHNLYTSEDAADGVPEREICKAAAEGRAVNERWHVRKDGSRFWGSGLVQPLRTGEGTIIGFLKIMRDMTEARQWQETLERQAEELKAADRRKDEFLATLAHELRNPLAPISNGLQMIRLAGGCSQVEHARAILERQLTHLVRLVDDLLDVNRITRGKLELRKKRVDLRKVIDTAVEATHPILEQVEHELTIVVPDTPVIVDGDAVRLAQVVSNLLTNSAKYTPRGGHIRLELAHDDGTAVISVIDNGIGIPPAMLDQVFEMFTQVDRSLEKSTGGLGIGLSLVRGLIEAHGGTVQAHSPGQGAGSTFTVYLPTLVHEGWVAVSEAQTSKGSEPPVRCRILVVDDNVDGADSLAEMLRFMGNETQTAYDGVAAIAAAETFRPDVILMDIGMPKLNGYEACRRIRGQSWGKSIVIIAQTGWGQDDDKRMSNDAGFDLHMVKPVDPLALEKIKERLRSTKGEV